MKVAYLGIPGSYSYNKALQILGKQTFEGFDSYRDIFENVTHTKTDIGIIPIENSLSGSIYENYDLLAANDVHIVGETYMKIEHIIACWQDSKLTSHKLSNPHEIYGRPKGFEQSSNFFKNHPSLHKNMVSDGAIAAEIVKENKNSQYLALTNPDAAKYYGLKVITNEISDDPDNYTRFILLSKKPLPPEKGNKASLVFVVSHSPGSLYIALSVFENYELNLTKIESRPVFGRSYEYIFYIDFEYGKDQVQKLDEIFAIYKENTEFLKILGYYKSEKKPQ